MSPTGVNVQLLSLVEAMGTRNQEFLLEGTIVPTWDARSDVWAQSRLVGDDASGAGALASGVAESVAVRVNFDCYLSAVFLVEPICTAIDTIAVQSAWLLRTTTGVTPFQVYGFPIARPLIGGLGTLQRTIHFEVPLGLLVQAGDLISISLRNNGAAATTGAATVGYRGFQGPPR